MVHPTNHILQHVGRTRRTSVLRLGSEISRNAVRRDIDSVHTTQVVWCGCHTFSCVLSLQRVLHLQLCRTTLRSKSAFSSSSHASTIDPTVPVQPPSNSKPSARALCLGMRRLHGKPIVRIGERVVPSRTLLQLFSRVGSAFQTTSAFTRLPSIRQSGTTNYRARRLSRHDAHRPQRSHPTRNNVQFWQRRQPVS